MNKAAIDFVKEFGDDKELMPRIVSRETIYSALSKMMSKDKSVEADTKGVYGKYPSHLACVNKVEELIKDSGLAYYQVSGVAKDGSSVFVETILTHVSGSIIDTGCVSIPVKDKSPIAVASAFGWAKRISLVQAFSLGTVEMETADEPKQEIHLDLSKPFVKQIF